VTRRPSPGFGTPCQHRGRRTPRDRSPRGPHAPGRRRSQRTGLAIIRAAGCRAPA